MTSSDSAAPSSSLPGANAPNSTVQIDDQGRPEPPVATDEVATLLGFLDYQRATLEWKTRGLDEAQLATCLHPTSMTLAGLLKHMAWVEQYWFGYRLHGTPTPKPWASVDWEADSDWDWNSAHLDSAQTLRTLFSAAAEQSRTDVQRALASAGVDQLAMTPWPDGSSPSLRWILVHMIEEYARHNGHADLLRESIDGETGE